MKPSWRLNAASAAALATAVVLLEGPGSATSAIVCVGCALIAALGWLGRPHAPRFDGASQDIADLPEILAAIINATEDYIGTADSEGRIIYHNRAFNEITGLSPEEIGSMLIGQFHPPWAGERVIREGFPAIHAHGSWTGETAILGVDGEEVPVLQTIIAHFDGSGALTSTSTVMKDIRPLKAKEAELKAELQSCKEAEAAARRASQAKSEFLA